MIPFPQLDQNAEIPLYRQLYESIRSSILNGKLSRGEKLPPTRELAGQLGLNRTTVSAAYELLENEGLIRGHVGRGSFVAGEFIDPQQSTGTDQIISFATSRPMEELFPLEDFRTTVQEVASEPEVTSLLQLGAPQGYAPLRGWLGGEVLITSGCQQALDLLQRVLVPQGSTVLVDDPTYPGLKNIFERAGVQLAPLDSSTHSASLAIVTPNFHNPTGRTMSLAERQQLLKHAADRQMTVVELDIYSQLRYHGEPLPSLAELDGSDSVIQIGSFSKIAFPGLRVGWMRGQRDLIARMTEAKQWMDLHTDQFSQAILLRFAESGRLDKHRKRVIEYGTRQLEATLSALEKEMPAGTTFSQPEGGMNLWVSLPAPMDASAMMAEAQRAGVAYLPARYFSIGPADPGSFRLSFGSLTPERIEQGIHLLGKTFRQEMPFQEFVTAMV